MNENNKFIERDDSPFCEIHKNNRMTLCHSGYICSSCWYEEKILGIINPKKIGQQVLDISLVEYNNEKEYVDRLEKFLKDCGFKTWREVIPKEHKYIEFPFRVDLIFYREDIGYIGVEAKNFRSLRQGGAVAKAINQIDKYRLLTYLNEEIKIKKWSIASPISIPAITSKEIEERVLMELSSFIQHFIDYQYDIKLLHFHEYQNSQWNRISIGSYTKDVINIRKEVENGDSIPEI